MIADSGFKRGSLSIFRMLALDLPSSPLPSLSIHLPAVVFSITSIYLMVLTTDTASQAGISATFHSFTLPLLALVSLIAWRAWRFSIHPRLRRHTLEYFSYWIPYLGHTLPFYRNAEALYARALGQFGQRPFMFCIRGGDWAVFTAQDHVACVMNDSSTYSVDIFYDTVQLLSSDGVGEILPRVLASIDGAMRWDSISKTAVLASNTGEKVLSLRCWCRDVLIDAQARAWFGPFLADVGGTTMRMAMDRLDFHSWLLTHQVPRLMAKQATRPRDYLLSILAEYLCVTREERKTEAAACVTQLRDECAHAGLDDADIAGILLILLWSMNINIPMSAFWMMAHLMHHPVVVDEIRQEIAPIMTKGVNATRHGGEATLARAIKDDLVNACPLLNSTFNETLRYYRTGSSIRQCTRDSQIDRYKLSKGTMVLLPVRNHLMSAEVFGPDAHLFNPYRFMCNSALERSEYFRPFGSGMTRCSGKNVAHSEVLALVALALWRFDIEAVEPGSEALGVKGLAFPRLDEAKPMNGVARQVEGDDMVLRVRERKIAAA
ncbi:cytochrome P450 [Aspergillus oleicola]